MEKSTNSGISFDGIGGYFKGLGEGWKTAKPLCVGLLDLYPSPPLEQDI
jgi:hypothetical protein